MLLSKSTLFFLSCTTFTDLPRRPALTLISFFLPLWELNSVKLGSQHFCSRHAEYREHISCSTQASDVSSLVELFFSEISTYILKHFRIIYDF